MPRRFRSIYWVPGRSIVWVLPGPTPYEFGDAFYQSRYLSNDGRLFFNSSDALVPQDTNGKEDVYEYEPDGIGACALDMDVWRFGLMALPPFWGRIVVPWMRAKLVMMCSS